MNGTEQKNHHTALKALETKVAKNEEDTADALDGVLKTLREEIMAAQTATTNEVTTLVRKEIYDREQEIDRADELITTLRTRLDEMQRIRREEREILGRFTGRVRFAFTGRIR